MKTDEYNKLVSELNSNIRCIEMRLEVGIMIQINLLNSNIRCIEIYPIPFIKRFTVC